MSNEASAQRGTLIGSSEYWSSVNRDALPGHHWHGILPGAGTAFGGAADSLFL